MRKGRGREERGWLREDMTEKAEPQLVTLASHDIIDDRRKQTVLKLDGRFLSRSSSEWRHLVCAHHNKCACRLDGISCAHLSRRALDDKVTRPAPTYKTRLSRAEETSLQRKHCFDGTTSNQTVGSLFMGRGPFHPLMLLCCGAVCAFLTSTRKRLRR